jgi:tRNA 2-selenouridine synthase
MARIQLLDATQYVAQHTEFDNVLDVRSPAEFAEDHIPGAINVPVLDDAQRAEVGTLYVQVSAFEARKLGAVLVAKNIAAHITAHFHDKPKDWKPLIYCWRGGQRSGAMAHILSQVGWHVSQLTGGYKSYRQYVRAELELLPAQLCFRVVCGPTGSGKSRLLQALTTNGAQVLDLEQLARHRGSLLGDLPGLAQPSQKSFESQLWNSLRQFSADRAVYVEAESRKIGALSLPDNLVKAMREAECLELVVSAENRASLLLDDYADFLTNPTLLFVKLDRLTPLYGKLILQHWRELAARQEWRQLVNALLEKHYDPAYQKSTRAHFKHFEEAEILPLAQLDNHYLMQAAQQLMGALP